MDTYTIYIPGPKSKNGKDGYLRVPSRLYDELAAMDLGTRNPEDYLFGNYSRTKNTGSTVHVKKEHRTRITDLFTEVFKKLNITNRNLYSFKHTGVVAAYKAGIKVKAIQQQLRHASLLETDNYLRGLGLYSNAEYEDADF